MSKLGPSVYIYVVMQDAAYAASFRRRIDKPEKYTVSMYPSGETFVAELAHHRFRSRDVHIVFLGYHFADGSESNLMNGIEVLEAIKVINRDVEVVMLCGMDETSYGAYARNCGAYAIVPTNDTVFLRANNIIMRILSQKTLERRRRAFRLSLQILLFYGLALAAILAAFYFLAIHSQG